MSNQVKWSGKTHPNCGRDQLLSQDGECALSTVNCPLLFPGWGCNVIRHVTQLCFNPCFPALTSPPRRTRPQPGPCLLSLLCFLAHHNVRKRRVAAYTPASVEALHPAVPPWWTIDNCLDCEQSKPSSLEFFLVRYLTTPETSTVHLRHRFMKWL